MANIIADFEDAAAEVGQLRAVAAAAARVVRSSARLHDHPVVEIVEHSADGDMTPKGRTTAMDSVRLGLMEDLRDALNKAGWAL